MNRRFPPVHLHNFLMPTLRTLIPKSFQLFGQTIRIKRDPRHLQAAEAHGLWSPHENTIRVLPEAVGYSNEYLTQVFWHEVSHAILDKLGYPKLSEDEELVDRMGCALHQTLSTMKT